MRTLILGSKGQLGRDLMQVFGEAGETQGFDLPELDIANDVRVRALIHDFEPDLVVNAAAYTDVDGAEEDTAGAFKTNEIGARVVAEAAQAYGKPVVYFSTDYVFDGTATEPYREDMPINPQGVYARSKAAGEDATREANARHIIIRTAWLYGPCGNNFPEKILRAAAKHPALKVVNDEAGSPTHTWDLAEATLALAQSGVSGTYHFVNEGSCTRYALAQEILSQAGVKTPIAPCASGEFPAKAPRPAYSVLATQKYAEATGKVPRAWQDALSHYMERREVSS